SSSSYEPYARGMPSEAAAADAFARSREAMATTRDEALRCIAGITFASAMFAAPRIPQRTGAPLSALTRTSAASANPRRAIAYAHGLGRTLASASARVGRDLVSSQRSSVAGRNGR